MILEAAGILQLTGIFLNDSRERFLTCTGFWVGRPWRFSVFWQCRRTICFNLLNIKVGGSDPQVFQKP